MIYQGSASNAASVHFGLTIRRTDILVGGFLQRRPSLCATGTISRYYVDLSMAQFLSDEIGTSLGAATFDVWRHVATERVRRQSPANLTRRRLVSGEVDDERGRSPVGRGRVRVLGRLGGQRRLVGRGRTVALADDRRRDRLVDE